MKTAVALQVTYPAEAGKLTDTLDYAITALDLDGKVKSSIRKKFEFSATPKASGDATFVINDVIDLPAQPLALRVGVASHHLGKIGVIHTSVDVPKLDEDSTQLGGIQIGYAGPPREEAKPKGALADLVPFQPTTDRAFSAADSLKIFAPVFWKGTVAGRVAQSARSPVPVSIGGGATGPGAATVTLSIRQGSRLLVERRDQLEPDAETSDTAALSHASFVATLPLKGVPPGDYVLTIAVSATGRPAKREVAFSIK
jgi:hypothetical protein